MNEIPPVTPESVARAKAAAEAERRQFGIELGPDGRFRIPVMTSVNVVPLRPLRMPQDRKAKLFGALDVLTQDWHYSVEEIRDALALLDAAEDL